MKSWKDIGFETEMTADGSLSLRLLHSDDPAKTYGESMHHSGGACAETNLIYGVPIRQTLQEIKSPHFMIVGLGLGYIEMVIAREALLLGLSASSVGLITSYESIPQLREYFCLWLQDRLGESGNLSEEIQQTYDSVVQKVLEGTSVSVVAIKNFLKEHFKSLNDIQGSLLVETSWLSQYHCILYDAFSSKTTPHLWQDDFLNLLFRNATAERSQFSTYACRGSMRTALRNQGFEVHVREAFKGKRTSTLGTKGFGSL